MTLDPVLTPRQNPIARAIIRADRGRFVRSPEGYRSLVADSFAEVEVSARTDLNWVPYTHFVMVCRNPRASGPPRGVG